MATDSIDIITKELLSDALQAYERVNDVKVISFEVSLSSEQGFMSHLYRVKVLAEVNKQKTEHHLVVKVMKKVLSTLAKSMRSFDKEHLMYSALLPKAAGLLVDVKMPVPTVYESAFGNEIPYIVMQDCVYDGFVPSKQKVGDFDFEHCTLVMKAIARIHAMSLVLGNGNTNNLRTEFPLFFKETLFSQDGLNMFLPGFTSAFAVGLKFFQNSQLFTGDQTRLRKFEVLKHLDVKQCLVDAAKPDANFNVLCHRDMNPTNFLFKYHQHNQDTPVDVKLVDFQCACVSPPVMDLICFLYSNTSPSMRAQHQEQLLDLYYNTLRFCAGESGDWEKFTIEHLREQFCARALCGLVQELIFNVYFSSGARKFDPVGLASDYEGTVQKVYDDASSRGQDVRLAEMVWDVLDLLP